MTHVEQIRAEGLDAVAHGGDTNNHDAPIVLETIQNYTPNGTTRTAWAAVRNFTIDCVLDARPQSVDNARRLMSVVGRYILWATNEMHADLDRDDLFYPAFITRYARTINDKASARQTTERQLYFVARAVAGTSAVARTTTNPRAKLIQPYTPRDLGLLDSWAAGQNTAANRRDAHTILGLAGGAGVRHGEVPDIRRHHLVESGPTGLTIHIPGAKARSVEIATEWQWYFDDYLAEADDGDAPIFIRELTFASYRRLLGRLGAGPPPYPSLLRLRDTWVLDVLRTTPLAQALNVIGFADPGALKRYLPHLTITNHTTKENHA